MKCLLVAVVADPHLGLDEHLLAGAAGAADSLADFPLVAVGGGGVDQPVPRLQRRVHGVRGDVRRCLEHPEAKRWHLDAVVQGQVDGLGHLVLCLPTRWCRHLDNPRCPCPGSACRTRYPKGLPGERVPPYRDRHRPHHHVAGELTISFEAMEFQRGNTGMSTWLITGCSTGLGRALAEAVLERGESAAITARDSGRLADLAKAYPGTALALALDGTDDA